MANVLQLSLISLLIVITLGACNNSQTSELNRKVTELSDQLGEIQDIQDIRTVKHDYGYYMDEKDFDSFKSLFAEPVILDLSARGVPKMTISKDEVVEFYKQQLTDRNTQHLFTDMDVIIEGDNASSKTTYYSIHTIDGKRTDSTGWAFDTFKKTEDGWKISGVRLVPYVSPN